MSIDTHPGTKPLNIPAPPSWGEIAPAGELATVIRFAMVNRFVSYPVAQFTRWEHAVATPETLILSTARDTVVIEGRDLAEIRAALELGRLCEVRTNYPLKSGARPGPQVRSITIEQS